MLEPLRPWVGLLLRNPLLLLGAAWLALQLAGPRSEGPLRHLLASRSTRTALACAVAFVVVLKVVLLGLSEPGFDHIAVQVVSVGSLFRDGLPLYHPLDAAARYAMLYGPAPYLVQAAVLAVLPDALASIKAVHVALYALALVVFARTCRRWAAGLPAAAVATPLLAGLSLSAGSFVLTPRGDLLLFAASALALPLGMGVRPGARGVLRGVGLGLLTALSIDTKLHAGLYLLPAWLSLAAGGGAAPLLGAGLAAAVATALPFLHPQIPFADYAALLRMAGAHGLSPQLLGANLSWALLLALPLLLVSVDNPERPGLAGRRVWLAGLCGAMGLVCVAAAKDGSGPHHLLPFLPHVVWGWIERADAVRRASLRAPRLALSFWIVLVALFGANQFFESRYIEPRLGRPAAADARAIVERLAPATVQIGLGARSLGRSGLAAKLAVAGQPHWFDAAALGDFSKAGLDPPPASAELLRSCATRFWLIPRGEDPFSMRSLYEPHPELFGEAFRRAFAESHTRIESTPYFDVWECRQNGSSSQRRS